MKIEEISNYEEAVTYVANKFNLSEEEVEDKEMVLQYDCEDDEEEYTSWFKDDVKLEAGTPIGFSIDKDDEESQIFPYKGLEERDF